MIVAETPVAFMYANAHSGICAVAHYASNCDGVTSTGGTSDRQDGPLEMHGKQSGNAQRFAKRSPFANALSVQVARAIISAVTSLSVTVRRKFPRLLFER